MTHPGAVGAEIRPVTVDDAAGILAIYRPIVEATAISFETEVPTEAEMASRIEAGRRCHAWLVCRLGGAIVGYAYTATHRARPAYRWACESSVYVAPAAHRRGIGRALYGALLAIAARQGYRTVLAGVAAPNPASVRLHESLGFRHLVRYRRIGHKLGAWHDVDWFEWTPASDEGPPTEPIPAAAVFERPDVLAAVRDAARGITDGK